MADTVTTVRVWFGPDAKRLRFHDGCRSYGLSVEAAFKVVFGEEPGEQFKFEIVEPPTREPEGDPPP